MNLDVRLVDLRSGDESLPELVVSRDEIKWLGDEARRTASRTTVKVWIGS